MTRPGPDAPRHCRDAVALPALLIVGALASVHGITPDDCGLWADLPRKTTP